MKILYIHQYFKLPNESGGTRSYWIAKKLVDRGHNVVVLSAKNNMNSPLKKTVFEGINIIYLNIPYHNSMGIYKRLKAFLGFMIKSCYHAFKEKKVDLVFATSTPLTVGVPALLVKWFKKTPFIFEVRDLWPEVPIQMGVIKNKILISLIKRLEKTIYNNSKEIIALSPGMKQGVLDHIKNNKKVFMIPNMAKIDIFYPREVNAENKTLKKLNLNKFNVIHFGAMGIANGLSYILKAAKLAKDRELNDLEFVFLGEGKVEPELKKYVEDNNLKNVKFLGAKPLLEVSEIVNACKVSLVSFSDIDILKTNSPNKLFDSLSAGKPIVVNSAGWTKDMVENNNCGLFVNPKSPEALIDKIMLLKNDEELYNYQSINSRKLAENKYDKSILIPEIVKIIEN